MKLHNWLIIAGFICNTAIAQISTITCTSQGFHNGEPPSLYMYADNNLFQESPYFVEIPLKKTNDTTWATQLKNSKAILVQLESAQILVLPNQKIIGYLHTGNEFFTATDSSDINLLLEQTTIHFQQLTAQYKNGTTFKEFSNLYFLIKKYYDSILEKIVSPEIKKKYGLNNEALSALCQYYNSKLAHFLVLPILYKNAYPDNLCEYIKRDIQIKESRYWIQTQWGRIFLKTFFTQYLLPKYKYNLNTCLAYINMFENKDIKKLLTFYYLDQSLNKEEDQVNLSDIRKNFSTFLTAYTFTNEEKKMVARISEKLSARNLNITSLFIKQHLVTLEKKELNNQQKLNLLESNDLLILDYWASWCAPCRERISKLKSDEIIINNKKSKIIFISVDNNHQDWVKSSYNIFNDTNSFRLTDFKSLSFYTSFEILTLPRMFLIEKSRLLSENFSY